MPSISYDGYATPIFLIVSPRTSRRQSSQPTWHDSNFNHGRQRIMTHQSWLLNVYDDDLQRSNPSCRRHYITTAYHFVWTRKCFHFLPHVTLFKYRHVRHSLNNMDSKQVVTDRFKSQWLVQADLIKTRGGSKHKRHKSGPFETRSVPTRFVATSMGHKQKK
jgi:hypothetical protein